MPKRSLQKADPATGSKKQKPAKAEISSSSEEQRKPDKGKELQALGDELKGLYTSNAVTARKAASVFKKAHNAGLRLNTPLIRHDKTFSLREAAEASTFKPAEGSEGGDLKPAEGKNAARTLQRWMRKNSTWPELYWATIPLKSGKTKEVKHEKMPFLPRVAGRLLFAARGGGGSPSSTGQSVRTGTFASRGSLEKTTWGA